MNSTTVQNVLRTVRGRLSFNMCEILWALVQSLPEDALILDICPGDGQSTVILAKAAEAGNKAGIRVVAVDSHITDPLSQRPHETGTLLNFLAHLRLFNVTGRVTALVAAPSIISVLLNKRSINLALVQVPTSHLDYGEALYLGIQQAQFAIRKGGVIVVPGSDTNQAVFEAVTDSVFGSDFEMTTATPSLRAYTHKGNKS